MYNLKMEAEKIIQQLKNLGYDAYFVGNYPHVKQHNLCHPNEKLKIKNIEIVTSAPFDVINTNFKVVEIGSLYCKYVNIELLIKQNKIKFKIYHSGKYTSVVSKKEKEVNTIRDILDNFSFLFETTMIENNRLIEYISKKSSSTESIKNKTFISNGNFREKLIENPAIILELCYNSSNISYSISDSMLKVISNNSSYLKYEPLEKIIRYFELILSSKNPIVGLTVIKKTILDFEYNGCKLFKFLENIDNSHLIQFSKFGNNIDIISRWAFLLKDLPQDEFDDICNNFKLKKKNKIKWLIDHFEIVDCNDQDYKMSIFNAKESLKQIVESEFNIFLLHEMFTRLTNVCMIDESLKEHCEKMIVAIYTRPYFEYQIMYDDSQLLKMAKLDSIDKAPWLDEFKIDFIKEIINMERHPNDEDYLQLLINRVQERI